MLHDKMKNQIAVIFFLFKINHLLSNEFDQSLQEKKRYLIIQKVYTCMLYVVSFYVSFYKLFKELKSKHLLVTNLCIRIRQVFVYTG